MVLLFFCCCCCCCFRSLFNSFGFIVGITQCDNKWSFGTQIEHDRKLSTYKYEYHVIWTECWHRWIQCVYLSTIRTIFVSNIRIVDSSNRPHFIGIVIIIFDDQLFLPMDEKIITNDIKPFHLSLLSVHEVESNG